MLRIRALRLSTSNLLGQKLECKQARQPDNIIWECRNIKGLKFYTNYIKWTLVLSVILFIIGGTLVDMQ